MRLLLRGGPIPRACADAVATLLRTKELRRTLAARTGAGGRLYTAKTTRELEQVYDEVLETGVDVQLASPDAPA